MYNGPNQKAWSCPKCQQSPVEKQWITIKVVQEGDEKALTKMGTGRETSKEQQ